MNDYSKTHCKYCFGELERDTLVKGCNLGNVVNYIIICYTCNIKFIWYVNQLTQFKVCYEESMKTGRYYRSF